MRIIARSLTASKAGCSPTSNEDAVWPAQLDATGRQWARFAIADGATSTIFSGAWAAAVVDAFGYSGHKWRCRIDALAARWEEHATARPMRWNVALKVLEGSDTTLCGAIVRERNGTIVVHLVAVGDSCAFRVAADGVIVDAFPITEPARFGTRPHLISTLAGHRADLNSHILATTWPLDPGERLVLATDAASAWLLTEPPDRVRTLIELVGVGDNSAYALWIDGERAAGHLRDDDTTILVVTASSERPDLAGAEV